MLHAGLLSARIIERDQEPAGVSAGLEPATATLRGIPHGVRHAIVLARNVLVLTRQDGMREVRFCQSGSYRVVRDSIDHADEGSYPTVDQTLISTSGPLPEDGYHPVRMRVSVNGSVHVHIESFSCKLKMRAPKPQKTIRDLAPAAA